MLKARYIMIGGFLGAGKTTAVGRLARYLVDRGRRVGLITNDQGTDLVDTTLLRSLGFATEEIAGGCFCCRFNSLMEAANKLTRETQPEVFIAEPVGSCTDLAATVTYPLRRLYGDNFVISPVSVLLDPVRAGRILGLEPGRQFSPKVLYIYRKQLEEADLLVINKADLLDPAGIDRLRQALSTVYPGKPILAVSARSGDGLESWFEQISNSEQVPQPAMDVNYQLYAEGEALLGWLNCTVRVESAEGFDANCLLQGLAEKIREELSRQGADVAHLKMTLSPDTGLGDIAAISLVRNDVVPELSLRLEEPVAAGQLILNLRAEADPELLGGIVRQALGQCGVCRIEHMEFFRPGKPMPTHRDG